MLCTQMRRPGASFLFRKDVGQRFILFQIKLRLLLGQIQYIESYGEFTLDMKQRAVKVASLQSGRTVVSLGGAVGQSVPGVTIMG